MKETVVHFYQGRVEKLTNPEKDSLPGDYVVEPDLTRVAGIPPEYWQLVDGEIFPQEGHVPDDGSLAVIRRHQDALANVGVVESIYADFERKMKEMKEHSELIAESVTNYTQEQCQTLSSEVKAQVDRLNSEVYFSLKRELLTAKKQRDLFYRWCLVLNLLSSLFLVVALFLFWRHFV